MEGRRPGPLDRADHGHRLSSRLRTQRPAAAEFHRPYCAWDGQNQGAAEADRLFHAPGIRGHSRCHLALLRPPATGSARRRPYPHPHGTDALDRPSHRRRRDARTPAPRSRSGDRYLERAAVPAQNRRSGLLSYSSGRGPDASVRTVQQGRQLERHLLLLDGARRPEIDCAELGDKLQKTVRAGWAEKRRRNGEALHPAYVPRYFCR